MDSQGIYFTLWIIIQYFVVVHSVMADALWPHGLQHVGLPCPLVSPRVCSNPCPSRGWCHPTISSSVTPLSSCLNLSQHRGLFQWVSSLHEVAKVLEFQFQHQSFQWIFRVDFIQDGLVWSCCPRDSLESSPATVWTYKSSTAFFCCSQSSSFCHQKPFP